MVSKRALEYKIEQMEQQAKGFGVTFTSGRDYVGALGPEITAHYSFRDNWSHKQAHDTIDKRDKALQVVLDLMGVREVYEQRRVDMASGAVYMSTLGFFLDDLMTIAESEKEARERKSRREVEKEARKRLSGGK